MCKYMVVCGWRTVLLGDLLLPLLAASSFHLQLYFGSRAAEVAETVGLTVAGLQRCFNGPWTPASPPGTRRWSCVSHPTLPKTFASFKQAGKEIRLCELSISGMAVTSACVCVCVCVDAPGRGLFHLHRSALSGKRCLQPLLTGTSLSGPVPPLELWFN